MEKRVWRLGEKYTLGNSQSFKCYETRGDHLEMRVKERRGSRTKSGALQPLEAREREPAPEE